MMKRLFQFILAFTLSYGMLMLVNAQENQYTQNKKQLRSETEAKEQVQLQDQNQNQGDTKNREQNKVIHGTHFVDKNGDGYHDNAPDHDGDGIPNGQDPDYQVAKRGNRKATYQDVDGDGIADNVNRARGQRNMKNKKGGYGPGNGTGYQGQGPKNGTGYGPGSHCDGTGPKGRNRNAVGLK